MTEIADELVRIQKYLHTYIIAPGEQKDWIEAAQTVSETAWSPVQVVEPNERLTAEQRLQIYRNMYPIRMRQALSVDFPVLHRVMGEEAFLEFITAYTETYPSDSHTLDDFGRAVIPFLLEHPQYKKNSLLAEVAQLEWAMVEVFRAPDDPAFTIDDFGALHPEDLAQVRFEPPRAFRRLNFRHNVFDLVQSHHNGESLPEVRSLKQGGVVWRSDLETWRWSLGEQQLAFLDFILEEMTILQAMEAFFQRYPDADDDFTVIWLQNFVEEGFFSKVSS